jgi:hypothetical protein
VVRARSFWPAALVALALAQACSSPEPAPPRTDGPAVAPEKFLRDSRSPAPEPEAEKLYRGALERIARRAEERASVARVGSAAPVKASAPEGDR